MKLDPRLEADTTFVTELAVCQVCLSHNAAFPWILLIPQRENIFEIMDLTPRDQQDLIQEISLASQVMRDLFHLTKLNVANLGNIVPQLHIHIVARFEHDSAWPHPIWNSGISAIYDADLKAERIALLRKHLNINLII